MVVGVIGAGNMGRAIAHRMAHAGESVVLADHDDAQAKRVAEEAGQGTPGEVIAGSVDRALGADLVVMAVWHAQALELASSAGEGLTGKIVIDILNPLDDTWVGLTTDPSTSAAEILAASLPGSRIVKAFNTTHAPVLFDGEIGGVPLDVFVASDDEDAKAAVSGLVTRAGLRPVDAGRLANARLLERLTAFSVELAMRYELNFEAAFKYLTRSELPSVNQ